MFSRKTVVTILIVGFFTVSAGFAQSLEENWSEFLHYAAIGRLNLAAGFAQAILDGEPDPVELLALSEKNQQSYALLLRAAESPHDAALAELSGKIVDIIDRGRFIRRSDPKIIVQEIRRLSKGARAYITAVKRLQDGGEYSVGYMLDAMADESRKEELPNIIRALPEIGRDAIRPLAAALQTSNVGIKAEIIKALGKIGYRRSQAYLKYIIETDDSAELRELAEQSIRQIDIDPVSLAMSGAELFYGLAEDYYYHAQSLAPAEDAAFANIWFWDSDAQRLVAEKVDKNYFNELMAMRACECALKGDAGFGQAIGLWLAAYFKAESTGVGMPNYFGAGHADAFTYATTAGAEYLHQALARAIKDGNGYVALVAIEALATTAGEKSLLYRIGEVQPLVQSLTFDDRAVRYSAAIAIAAAGPKEDFDASERVIKNLAEAIEQSTLRPDENAQRWDEQLAYSYAIRAAEVMLKLAQARNRVIDLSAAQNTLINATLAKSPGIQTLCGRVLAYLNSPDAQRSIAAMALAKSNSMDVRIAGFGSLAISAKLNANLLDNEMIDAIYLLVGSQQIDPQLRSAAACAYGALNLPSEKVKDLILDQARN